MKHLFWCPPDDLVPHAQCVLCVGGAPALVLLIVPIILCRKEIKLGQVRNICNMSPRPCFYRQQTLDLHIPALYNLAGVQYNLFRILNCISLDRASLMGFSISLTIIPHSSSLNFLFCPYSHACLSPTLMLQLLSIK